MVYSKSYVNADSHGALRIGSSDVSLDSVVIAYREGHSAETIQQLYPALNLEEVHGAVAFYLANQGEVHEHLRRQNALWTELRQRAEHTISPLVQRLRQIEKTSNRATS